MNHQQLNVCLTVIANLHRTTLYTKFSEQAYIIFKHVENSMYCLDNGVESELQDLFMSSLLDSLDKEFDIADASCISAYVDMCILALREYRLLTDISAFAQRIEREFEQYITASCA